MSTFAEPSAAQQVFDEIVEAQLSGTAVTIGPAFAGEALQVDGKIFAFLRRDRLIVKLPAYRVDAIAAAGQGEHCETRPGHPMREWLATPLLATDDADRWRALADEARTFVARVAASGKRAR